MITSEYQLVEELFEYDSRNSTRGVVIRFLNPHSDLEIVHIALDNFLRPRLYWFLLSEPWRHLKGFIPKTTAVLVKANPRVENYLRWKSSMQNPFECKNSSMVVLNGLTTWGQDLSFHHVSSCQRPYAIIGTFFSSFGDPSQSNAFFVEAETCPTVVDKFLCAFLPTTNCSIPESFPLRGEEFSTHHFSTATIDGALIFGKEVIAEEYVKWFQGGDPSRQQPYFLGQRFLPSSGRVAQSLRIKADDWVLAHGLLYRPNYRFRELISKRVMEFRESTSPYLHPAKSCAAVHIRRGDRVIPALSTEDTAAFCRFCEGMWQSILNGSSSIEEQHYTNAERNINISCGGSANNPNWLQMGCRQGEKAFGAFALLDYLDAIRTMTGGPGPGVSNASQVRDVVVMTDSGDWVYEQIQLLPRHEREFWHIHVFPAGRNHRSVSTEGGVDFLASLEVVKQCSSFVGMISCSYAAKFILGAMCMRHALPRALDDPEGTARVRSENSGVPTAERPGLRRLKGRRRSRGGDRENARLHYSAWRKTWEREHRMMECPAFFDACWNAAKADTVELFVES